MNNKTFIDTSLLVDVYKIRPFAPIGSKLLYSTAGDTNQAVSRHSSTSRGKLAVAWIRTPRRRDCQVPPLASFLHQYTFCSIFTVPSKLCAADPRSCCHLPASWNNTSRHIGSPFLYYISFYATGWPSPLCNADEDLSSASLKR